MINRSSYFCEDTNRLDPKGRVCLPSILRQQLPEDASDSVYCYLDVKETRILLFDALFMKDLMDNISDEVDNSDLQSIQPSTIDDIRAMDKLKEERAKHRRDIYSSVSTGFLTRVSLLKIDDAGRISLSPRMRKHAKLDKDIYFCGLGRAIGVYDPELFAKNYFDNTESGQAARSHVEEIMRGLP